LQINDTLQKTMLPSHMLSLGAPGRRWEPIMEHETVLKVLERARPRGTPPKVPPPTCG
jgi:GntR family transcriptional regulator, transcriptional repressor for pyruvate dehydrogenase complex